MPKKKTGDNIAKLQKQIDDLKTGWQRTQADFENYQKRVEVEKLENLAYAKAEFMTKIAPVLDNFELAFKHAPHHKSDTHWIVGIQQIKKQLQDLLASEGLKQIPSSSGTKFDPALHEAISCEENDLPTDTIIGTLESGWQFQGRVLKPAKVRVSRGK